MTKIKSNATAVPNSKNAKIGDMSATYVSELTCPPTCPLKGAGCYGESGLVRLAWSRVSNDKKASLLQCAIDEAAEIDRLPAKGKYLRLHVVGDSTTDEAARIVSDAATRYTERGGGKAYTYTHGWRGVDRSSWGKVSVLASCETNDDIVLARSLGYATAKVVDHHTSDKAYVEDGQKLLPCPQQTGKVADCASCGLCMIAGNLLAAKITIAFAVHGAGSDKAKTAIAQRNAE